MTAAAPHSNRHGPRHSGFWERLHRGAAVVNQRALSETEICNRIIVRAAGEPGPAQAGRLPAGLRGCAADGCQHVPLWLVLGKILARTRMQKAWFAKRMSQERVVRGNAD